MFQELQRAFRSKTIIAATVSMVAGVLTFLGIAIDPATQLQITNVIMAMGSIVGSIIAIYGRIVATKLFKDL